jgi:hypothetical protein
MKAVRWEIRIQVVLRSVGKASCPGSLLNPSLSHVLYQVTPLGWCWADHTVSIDFEGT